MFFQLPHSRQNVVPWQIPPHDFGLVTANYFYIFSRKKQGKFGKKENAYPMGVCVFVRDCLCVCLGVSVSFTGYVCVSTCNWVCVHLVRDDTFQKSVFLIKKNAIVILE